MTQRKRLTIAIAAFLGAHALVASCEAQPDANTTVEIGPHVDVDYNQDGYTEILRFQLHRYTDTGGIHSQLSGIYLMDGECQCWSSIPIILAGDVRSLHVLDTPDGKRLLVTRGDSNVLSDHWYAHNQDTGLFEPVDPPTPAAPGPSQLIDHVTMVSPQYPNQQYYGGPFPYAWEVRIQPQNAVSNGLVNTICTEVRPYNTVAWEPAVCAPVGGNDMATSFYFGNSGVGIYSPHPDNAWCAMHAPPDVGHWEARAYAIDADGGIAYSTNWTDFYVYSCPNN